MMSMVAEESASTPQTASTGNGNVPNQSSESKDQKPPPSGGGKQLPKLSRAAQSILQMRTVGAVVKQVQRLRVRGAMQCSTRSW